MARKKTVKKDEELAGKEKKLTINDEMASFLKENKEFHYNFEDEIFYKVSSGSLMMDLDLQGGINPGLHRFCGPSESGKTSAALSFMNNFLLKPSGRRGFLIKAEGRLGPEIKKRSGVKFVYDMSEWEDGTCFVLESNIYETVVEAMRKLVGKNPDKKKYFFLLDSVDGLISKNDLDKSFEESTKVAGGAVIASNFMKRASIPLQKRGHIAIFISQVRANIQLDPYSKEPIRQTTATGGNALLHFANYILEFNQRFNPDLILENPSEKKYDPIKNKYIGHFAKCVVKKSPNEKTNCLIRYPIRYGKEDGKSIWVERELVDLMKGWGFLKKAGAWYTFCPVLKEELEGKYGEIEMPEKVQGENGVLKVLEENEKLQKCLYEYFKDAILSE